MAACFAPKLCISGSLTPKGNSSHVHAVIPRSKAVQFTPVPRINYCSRIPKLQWQLPNSTAIEMLFYSSNCKVVGEWSGNPMRSIRPSWWAGRCRAGADLLTWRYQRTSLYSTDRHFLCIRCQRLGTGRQSRHPRSPRFSHCRSQWAQSRSSMTRFSANYSLQSHCK